MLMLLIQVVWRRIQINLIFKEILYSSIVCAYGCGNFPKQGNAYILGHNWKGKKREPRSIEHSQNLSNSLTGRKLTNSHRENISKAVSGEKHPMYGKHHTEETRKQIAETEKKLKRIPWNKGKKGCYSEESLNRFSIATIKVIKENGGIPPGLKNTIKGYFYSIKNNKEIHYESSYELKAYNILEMLDKVRSYDRCNFFIPYVVEGKTKRYIPDIFVDYFNGVKEIIEVKPKDLINKGKNIFKIEALKTYCLENGFKYSIWDESFLFMKDICIIKGGE